MEKNELRHIYCSSKLILFLQIAMLEISFDLDLVMKIESLVRDAYSLYVS